MKKAATPTQAELEKIVYCTTNWALYNEALMTRYGWTFLIGFIAIVYIASKF
jgi:hypothetical protein